MERVIKGAIGRYIPEKEGKPATHVILSVEEFSKLMSDINQAKSETQSIIAKAKKEIASCKKQTADLLVQEKENTQKRIGDLQSQLYDAQTEIHRLNDLNANLVRVCRERANAKRGLKPKKVHHGYVVLDSQQSQYIFRWEDANGKFTSANFSCWKVRIQSPYDSSIPFLTITKNIHEDLVHVFGANLGIQNIYGNLDKRSYDDILKLWKEDRNFIFKTSYKANNRKGLWEIEYLVKSDIQVPEDMRTRYSKDVKGEEEKLISS